MNLVHRTRDGRPKAWTAFVGRRWSLVAMAALVCLICFAGTAAARSQGSAASKPTLSIGQPFSGYQFWHDPATFGAAGREIAFELSTTYGGLFHTLPNGTQGPEIATTWKYFTSGNGANKDFQFTIRHDVKFADGTPLTAAAIVGWFNHVWAQHSQPSAGYSTLLGPDPKFKAVGKWTVQMFLTVPTPGLTNILSDTGFMWGYIASPTCVANPTLFNTQSCGAGPYQIDPSQTVASDHYTYIPNPHYYAPADIHFSKVTVKVIPVGSTALQALEAGQLNIVSVGTDPSTAAAAKSAGLNINTATIDAMLLFLHADGKVNKALADVRVRQAINYAIDRKAIADSVGFGYSKPTDVFPNTDATDPKYVNYYNYDPTKAKSLLAAAGYSNGLTITTHTTGQQLLWLPLIAKYLDAVGINLVNLPFNTANTATYFLGDALNVSSYGFNSTPAQYLRWISPKSGSDVIGNDTQINKLFYQGLKAKDPTIAWKQMWDRYITQGYSAPICTLPVVYYSSKSVSGTSYVTAGTTGALDVTELSIKN
jgi:peptide/nickel transport system substrate-binding protein